MDKITKYVRMPYHSFDVLDHISFGPEVLLVIELYQQTKQQYLIYALLQITVA